MVGVLLSINTSLHTPGPWQSGNQKREVHRSCRERLRLKEEGGGSEGWR